MEQVISEILRDMCRVSDKIMAEIEAGRSEGQKHLMLSGEMTSLDRCLRIVCRIAYGANDITVNLSNRTIRKRHSGAVLYRERVVEATIVE